MTGIDGEVVVDEHGRKMTAPRNGEAPAGKHKAHVEIDDGVLIVTRGDPSPPAAESLEMDDISRQRQAGRALIEDERLSPADEQSLAQNGVEPNNWRKACAGDAIYLRPICALGDGSFMYQRHINQLESTADWRPEYVQVTQETRERLGLKNDPVRTPDNAPRQKTAVRIRAEHLQSTSNQANQQSSNRRKQ